jgi:hypothetical protein
VPPQTCFQKLMMTSMWQFKCKFLVSRRVQIVEDCEERFTAEQIDALIELVRKHLRS